MCSWLQNSFVLLCAQLSTRHMACIVLYCRYRNRFPPDMPHSVDVFHIWQPFRKESKVPFRLGSQYKLSKCHSVLLYCFATWLRHLRNQSNSWFVLGAMKRKKSLEYKVKFLLSYNLWSLYFRFFFSIVYQVAFTTNKQHVKNTIANARALRSFKYKHSSWLFTSRLWGR